MSKKEKSKSLTPEDECFKIIQAIWSCKDDEQKKGCENMLKTYIKKHGDDNIGITFIKIELMRLEKIIKLTKLRNEQMKKVQDGLAAQKKEQDEKLEGMPPPTNEQLQKAMKEGNIINLPNAAKN